jgi:hypothetical protein
MLGASYGPSLSIDAAQRFRKRIAAGRFDLAFADPGSSASANRELWAPGHAQSSGRSSRGADHDDCCARTSWRPGGLAMAEFRKYEGWQAIGISRNDR